MAEIDNWVDKLIKINITDQASKESKMIETQYGITEELIDESGGLERKTISFIVYPLREGKAAAKAFETKPWTHKDDWETLARINLAADLQAEVNNQP